jgi:phospholipase/carboxylesterase
MTGDDPHGDRPLVTAGEPLETARAALVTVHGREATARSIAGIAREFDAEGVALLAPQAARNTWYPNSFLAPVAANEPGRSSGLRAVGRAVDRAVAAGLDRERVLVLGFSQGACLASEFVARTPDRYGGLVALSGGLIGETVADDYAGDLGGTPVFFGCSDDDPHVPEERVHESAAVFERLGADVETRIYEGLGHGVDDDELNYVEGMVRALVE